MNLTLANKNQAGEISNLVNLAYRGERGWTRETHIVAGERATKTQIESIIDKPHSHVLIYVTLNQIISCVCIDKSGNNAHIGLLAVHPTHQGRGIGKTVLALAEEYGALVLGVKKHIMAVISQRQELIAYYERRDYVRTGETIDYPTDLGAGTPISTGLTIEHMEKIVSNQD